MKNDQWYIEQTDDGRYSLTKGGAKRASGIEGTQVKAIDRAKEIDPKASVHVERVRDTKRGSRDKWRKP